MTYRSRLPSTGGAGGGYEQAPGTQPVKFRVGYSF